MCVKVTSGCFEKKKGKTQLLIWDTIADQQLVGWLEFFQQMDYKKDES